MNTQSIKQGTSFSITINSEHVGQRIDKYITQYFQQYSRSFLQKLFEKNQILINQNKSIKPSYLLKLNDIVAIEFPEEKNETSVKEIPSSLNITIVKKEKDFLIVNKPAGLVVHAPNSYSKEITLSDWIINTHQEIAHVGLIDRPGIVHRLDKDTSGLMIIPRTNHAHHTFTNMFKQRSIHKTYLAIVVGNPSETGTIDFYIGRHPIIRNKMHFFTESTKHSNCRTAITHYKVIQYFKDYALVELKPITGRTHQIRVHCAAIGHPLLGDPVYGTKSKILNRHALHAYQLAFEYNQQNYIFTSPLEHDLQIILQQLKPL